MDRELIRRVIDDIERAHWLLSKADEDVVESGADSLGAAKARDDAKALLVEARRIMDDFDVGPDNE